MKIFVWNVNGLNATYRNIELKYGKGQLKKFFQEHDADVICLQIALIKECKLQEKNISRDIACVDGYESFWACSIKKKGYSGVSTWVSEQYSPVDASKDFLGNGSEEFDKEGRILLTDLKEFVLINIYVPNAGDNFRLEAKLRFMRLLNEKLISLKEQNRSVIVVGDFNVCISDDDLHPTFDLNTAYLKSEQDAFKVLLREHIDTWRVLNPHVTDQYTVFSERMKYRETNKGLRIDYALVSPSLMDKVVSCEIIYTPKKWSDHTAVLLELKDIPAIPKHSPCALSSAVKFRQQKTLLSMFSTKAKESSDEKSHKRDSDQSAEKSVKKPKTSSLS